jgi:hypothetical protein
MAQDDDDDDAGQGTGVVRSPRYPAISLRDAVAKVKAIYDKDKTAGTPMQAVWPLIGYSSKSGPAVMALAALKRFGLVEVRANRAFPTARAVAIICLPEKDQRRKDALADAASSPGLYRELLDKYRNTGLPSVDSLKHELILDDRFNHNAIPSLVKDFFSSLRYAGLTNDDGVLLGVGGGESPGDEDLEVPADTIEKPDGSKKLHPPGAGLKDFPLYTSEQKGALYVPARMSRAEFDLVKKQIDSYLLVIEATSVVANES